MKGIAYSTAVRSNTLEHKRLFVSVLGEEALVIQI